MTDFIDFGLQRPLMAALERERHETPTPIQARAIPALMEGRDVLGLAQTGSGKTAAFALPILNRLMETPRNYKGRGKDALLGPRAVVLSPTRELATQIRERFCAYGSRTSVSFGLAIGGANIGKQKAMLRRGVDVLVATPGRLEDLLAQKATVLDQVEMLVLDEVDQMLDMGFIQGIRRICDAAPAERQNIFFSATMPREIKRFAHALLNDPYQIKIDASERPKITQSVQFLSKAEKPAALVQLVKTENVYSGLVFSRTKYGADKIARVLSKEGIRAEAIHGNRSQGQRERALKAFKTGKVQILVATDIASRGIDIAGVSHVINYDLPNVPETYVHRIGRTGRAGATGIAISFCDREERAYLGAIERLMGQKLNGEPLKASRPRSDRAPKRGSGRPDSKRSSDHRSRPNRGAAEGQHPQRKTTPGEERKRPAGRRNRPLANAALASEEAAAAQESGGQKRPDHKRLVQKRGGRKFSGQKPGGQKPSGQKRTGQKRSGPKNGDQKRSQKPHQKRFQKSKKPQGPSGGGAKPARPHRRRVKAA